MSDYEIGGDNRRIYYGVAIGILMVRTYFTRYLGDIGNAATWEFPVSYKIVEDAIPSKMTDLHNASLLEPFKVAAKELVAEGVSGITTTCGFLSIYQNELADHCGVPVASSSLLQVSFAQTIIGTQHATRASPTLIGVGLLARQRRRRCVAPIINRVRLRG